MEGLLQAGSSYFYYNRNQRSRFSIQINPDFRDNLVM
ncbi:hypothetical protein V6Z11_D05G437000 [Gossypium hirsutum]